eukprot:5325174-Ditylum_brightwellii.AAC.1
MAEGTMVGFAENSGDEMTYHIYTKEKKPQNLIRSISCTQHKHVVTERKRINEDSSLQPELKAIELEFFNKHEDPINASADDLAIESS